MSKRLTFRHYSFGVNDTWGLIWRMKINNEESLLIFIFQSNPKCCSLETLQRNVRWLPGVSSLKRCLYWSFLTKFTIIFHILTTPTRPLCLFTSGQAGVRKGYWGWGNSLIDFNNDRWLDFLMTNGKNEKRSFNTGLLTKGVVAWNCFHPLHQLSASAR